jgi:hypothetical protein
MGSVRMKHLRPAFLLMVALAAALVAVGCGSAPGSGSGAGGDTMAGAEVAPANAVAFVSVNTDVNGAQWNQARALLAKFPGSGKLLDQALASIEKEGVSWETDVKPALGAVLDVVVVQTPAGTEEVGLLQSADKAKLDALLAKSRKQPVTEEIDGWTAVADSQAVLDAFDKARANGVLADSDAFGDATAGLPAEKLVAAYVNGAEAVDALRSAKVGDKTGGVDPLAGLTGNAGLDWASGSIVAESDGLRLGGDLKGSAGAGSDEFESRFVTEVPSGALLFADFSGGDKALDQVLKSLGESNPQFDQQLAQVELALGLSVRDDLLPLFAGETAIGVWPGGPIPTISLILTANDPQQAMSTVDQLVSRIGLFAGGQVPQPTATTIDGVAAKELSFGQFSIYYAAFDGKLVITTSKAGIGGLTGSGTKLVADPSFTAARDAAEMPAKTNGYVYADVAGLADLVAQYAQLSGDPVPQDAQENLRHLGGLVLWATRDGDRTTFSGFLGVK